MGVKIENPYFRTATQQDAESLAPVVLGALQANAQAAGPVVTLAEVRAMLVPEDAAKLTRAVFNEICRINGWRLVDPAEV